MKDPGFIRAQEQYRHDMIPHDTAATAILKEASPKAATRLVGIALESDDTAQSRLACNDVLDRGGQAPRVTKLESTAGPTVHISAEKMQIMMVALKESEDDDEEENQQREAITITANTTGPGEAAQT